MCGLRADDGSKLRIGRCPSGDGNRIASLDLDRHRSSGRGLVRSATRPLQRRNRPIQASLVRAVQRTCGEKVRRRNSGCAVAVAVAVRTGPEALQARCHGQMARIAGAAGRRIVRPLQRHAWAQCHADFVSGSTSGVFAGTMHNLHPASPHFAGPIAMRLRQTQKSRRCESMFSKEMERRDAWPWAKSIMPRFSLSTLVLLAKSQHRNAWREA